VAAAAESRGVSRATAHKWRRRFEQEGVAGLEDRSAHPGVDPTRSARDRSTGSSGPAGVAKQVLYQLSYVPVCTCGNSKPRPCTPLPQWMISQHLIDGAAMRDAQERFHGTKV